MFAGYASQMQDMHLSHVHQLHGSAIINCWSILLAHIQETRTFYILNKTLGTLRAENGNRKLLTVV